MNFTRFDRLGDVRLRAVSAHLPSLRVATTELFSSDPALAADLVRLTGIEHRHYAAASEATSDLAIAAARPHRCGFTTSIRTFWRDAISRARPRFALPIPIRRCMLCLSSATMCTAMGRRSCNRTRTAACHPLHTRPSRPSAYNDAVARRPYAARVTGRARRLAATILLLVAAADGHAYRTRATIWLALSAALILASPAAAAGGMPRRVSTAR